MAKRIRAERVERAMHTLAAWRDLVPAQGATHLFPLLVLLERGAGALNGPVVLNEQPHEFEFYDRFLRIEDANAAKPYFNPITQRRAEAGFPHSNSATIRKNTFAMKWGGASRAKDGSDENWTLADDYADVTRDKVMTKGGKQTRAPVLDLAAILFRGETFDDAANAKTLEDRFKATFPQRPEDYEKLFAFRPEDDAHLFAPAEEPQDYDAAIKGALVDDVVNASAIPVEPTPPKVMDTDDEVLVQVQRLIAFGTSGIILAGAPGTGKSYYAKRIGRHLVVDEKTDVFRVQLHPSYGYEDFVEGYKPDDKATAGYSVVNKTFVLACERAKKVAGENRLVVVIVDEINRGDPARVFGELLTYIEHDYRGESFTLPFSGNPFSVPHNLVLIGTMNPHDRSIAQADAAFTRRFDKIDIKPSRETAELLLEEGKGFTAAQVQEIGAWFDNAQKLTGAIGLGHSFFKGVKNLDDLKLVWRYRMLPTAIQTIEMGGGDAKNLESSFDALIQRIEGTPPDG